MTSALDSASSPQTRTSHSIGVIQVDQMNGADVLESSYHTHAFTELGLSLGGGAAAGRGHIPG